MARLAAIWLAVCRPALLISPHEERKWVERLAVTIVRAVNVSGIPQTQTVLYSRLWLRPGMPWTVSALAEATSRDRASVRGKADITSAMARDQTQNAAPSVRGGVSK